MRLVEQDAGAGSWRAVITSAAMRTSSPWETGGTGKTHIRRSALGMRSACQKGLAVGMQHRI